MEYNRWESRHFYGKRKKSKNAYFYKKKTGENDGRQLDLQNDEYSRQQQAGHIARKDD